MYPTGGKYLRRLAEKVTHREVLRGTGMQESEGTKLVRRTKAAFEACRPDNQLTDNLKTEN